MEARNLTKEEYVANHPTGRQDGEESHLQGERCDEETGRRSDIKLCFVKHLSIRVDFLLSNGKAIASSSQPCMLRFRSEPIRLITTLLKIAPLVTGYTSETQTLNVKMTSFVEGDLPTSCLKVTLEQ
ncbi:hypothetical protein VNO80_13578 [Phaseolus coccineus]|uniref:Uncharacterized protein n=1 Tax=Phaseolus coccineus TaxID=3886 RepID=A0AAN9RBD6_PHACN